MKAVLLHVGAVEPVAGRGAEAGERCRAPHSPQWAPDFKPTVGNTIKAETAILLDLLAPKK